MWQAFCEVPSYSFTFKLVSSPGWKELSPCFAKSAQRKGNDLSKVMQLERDRVDPLASRVLVLNCYIASPLFNKMNSRGIYKHGRNIKFGGDIRKHFLKASPKLLIHLNHPSRQSLVGMWRP